MIENPMDRHQKFLVALKDMFAGENGKMVIEYLKEAFVEPSVLSQSTEETFYRLGQKEFVQGFINDATKPIEE
jgi:hypothetical protein